MGRDHYNMQIDVNITDMEGTVATIHNGTSLFSAGDSLEVDFEGGKTHFTYNATGYQSVFIKFTGDKADGSHFFSANVGLRPLEKEDDEDEEDEDEDEDDEKKPFYRKEAIPMSKEVTFNEEVVMVVVVFGIIVMCCKNRHCYDGPTSKWICCGLCRRVKSETDFVEKEYAYKVRVKEQDFDVNLENQPLDEVTKETEEPENGDEEKDVIKRANKLDRELIEVVGKLSPKTTEALVANKVHRYGEDEPIIKPSDDESEIRNDSQSIPDLNSTPSQSGQIGKQLLGISATNQRPFAQADSLDDISSIGGIGRPSADSRPTMQAQQRREQAEMLQKIAILQAQNRDNA